MKSLLILIFILIDISLLGCGMWQTERTQKENKPASTNEIDKFRPKFHFTPKKAWMNDPNGLVYQNGKYHLFFQYYPDNTKWGPMHWGHAISKDLIKWKQEPIALYPDKLGYIFSGSAVIDRNNTAGFGKNALVAIFTYHNPELEKKGSNLFQT